MAKPHRVQTQLVCPKCGDDFTVSVAQARAHPEWACPNCKAVVFSPSEEQMRRDMRENDAMVREIRQSKRNPK